MHHRERRICLDLISRLGLSFVDAYVTSRYWSRTLSMKICGSCNMPGLADARPSLPIVSSSLVSLTRMSGRLPHDDDIKCDLVNTSIQLHKTLNHCEWQFLAKYPGG